MEGISHEACSLAGTLELGKLIALYDDNGISIDGAVAHWFTDDTPKRFEAYGWHVIADVDGHDVDAVDARSRSAQARPTEPTLICCKTIIGKGAPNSAGTARRTARRSARRKSPLTREALGWSSSRRSRFRQEIYAAWDAQGRRRSAEADWKRAFAAYERAYPDWPPNSTRRMAGELPADLRARSPQTPSPPRTTRPRRSPRARLAARDRGVRRRAAGIDRRLGRPDRLEPDQHEDSRRCASTPKASDDTEGRPATTSTTACASSAWRPS